MDNVKVLLVEDDQEDAVLTLRALKKNNIEHKVYVVRDGAEALDFLFCTNKFAKRDPQDLPQLMLLDIELPAMNGLEVLRRVRADDRTHQLPVVILSSSNEEQTIVESYKRGANSYVSKPTDFAQFMESVRTWLILVGIRRRTCWRGWIAGEVSRGYSLQSDSQYSHKMGRCGQHNKDMPDFVKSKYTGDKVEYLCNIHHGTQGIHDPTGN
jgi:CheY-like chemotaxis protein